MVCGFNLNSEDGTSAIASIYLRRVLIQKSGGNYFLMDYWGSFMEVETSDLKFSRGYQITQLQRALLLPESVSSTFEVVLRPVLGGHHRGNSQISRQSLIGHCVHVRYYISKD